jgi:hypothetical protein
MKRIALSLAAMGCLALLSTAAAPQNAVAQDAAAIVDKAIKAHGGEEALGKVKAYSFVAKGAFYFMGNESAVDSKATTKGLDHTRQEIELDFGGNKVQGVTVLAGDKAWRNFGDMGVSELDAGQLANTKRMTYINTVAITLLPLKAKEFKTTLGGEEKVGDKPAVGVKATGPDGKDFTLFFDKESGMLVKITADGVLGFGGEEFKQEVLFTDYKEMGGIKKSTKSESLRNGEKFATQEITEFKVLEKVEDSTFAEPK